MHAKKNSKTLCFTKYMLAIEVMYCYSYDDTDNEYRVVVVKNE